VESGDSDALAALASLYRDGNELIGFESDSEKMWFVLIPYPFSAIYMLCFNGKHFSGSCWKNTDLQMMLDLCLLLLVLSFTAMVVSKMQQLRTRSFFPLANRGMQRL
jgi:hypothetical protein